jgi:hypothetical protein
MIRPKGSRLDLRVITPFEEYTTTLCAGTALVVMNETPWSVIVLLGTMQIWVADGQKWAEFTVLQGEMATLTPRTLGEVGK